MEFSEVIEFYSKQVDECDEEYSVHISAFSKERWARMVSELISHEFVLFPEPAQDGYTSWKCAKCGIIFSASKSRGGFSTTGHILNMRGKWPRGSFPGMCNLNMTYKALK
jgi:hypothetical protein